MSHVHAASLDGHVEIQGDAPFLGVVSMDEAHRVEAALLAEIGHALDRGDLSRYVEVLLVRLLGEASDAFASEDELMRVTGFPGRAAHAEDHERLLRLLTELVSRESGVAPDQASAVQRWFREHTRQMDEPLGAYLVAYSRSEMADLVGGP